MTDCERCGDTLQRPRDMRKGNQAYRDRCLPCLDAITRDIDPDARRSPADWLDQEPAPEGWDE